MMEVVFTAFSIFPVSFLYYCWTERLIARHESRVGRQISFPAFVWQTWVDTLVDVRAEKTAGFWLLFGFQASLPFLYSIHLAHLMLPWMVLNGFLLTVFGFRESNPFDRIDRDQKQVSFAVASAISLWCLAGAFAVSKTADIGSMTWSPLHLVFVIPFQVGGMILFRERPFRGLLERSSWLGSVVFYGWTLIAVRVFLGGGEYFVDTNLKAGVLFVLSRLFAVYFPRVRQKDLLSLSSLYLFPVSGALWLVIMLARAFFSEGVSYD
jgi:hypothetical protein